MRGFAEGEYIPRVDAIGLYERFEISEETLALDTIHRVGPAGHFLTEEHTLEHFRTDVWYPTIFDRDRFDNWQKAGARDTRLRARDRVKDLLK